MNVVRFGMGCPICSGIMAHSFNAKVLGKYDVNYEVCGECGYLRAAEPHWLDEAYTRAIAAADTGLVMRNLSIAYKLSGVLHWVIKVEGGGRYLDAAGGYGMLTRLMRDLGFDFYWADKYCENFIAPGFEYSQETGPCTAVTAMEVLEHVTDPLAFIEESMAMADAEVFIFTTELYDGLPPAPDSWWYYAFGTGQHIGFFQRRTLEILGNKLGLSFASANGIHILSKTAVNEQLLRLVTGRLVSRIMPWWLRRRRGSKTMSDHYLMLQRID